MERKKLNQIARSIVLFVSDVDGVLTDAGMYYSAQGDVMKKFNTHDGMGLDLWQKAGFESCLMTQENSEIVLRRGEKLRIPTVLIGVKDKGSAMRKLMSTRGLRRNQVGYIGDDLNDLPAFGEAGLRLAPADAVPAVRRRADYVCRVKGGDGAVRECLDWILAAKGLR
jgi:3-deoxy-D-manno-octulosonate 8-phosphate phosphatase (KDO 8-P phosphatase)